MSLNPRICFVCHLETYNLQGHLQNQHTQCTHCQKWNKLSSQQLTNESKCFKCQHLLKEVAPTEPVQIIEAPRLRHFFTKKCAYHKQGKVTMTELRNCSHCHVHPVGK